MLADASGAITGDRNANTAINRRDVAGLRRERWTATAIARACDRNVAQSSHPNNIHQQDIWTLEGRRSGALLRRSRPRCFSTRSARRAKTVVVVVVASVQDSAQRGASLVLVAGRNARRDSDGNYSSSGYLLRATGKNPREETH